jgi:putative transcriptional regulator
MEELLMSDVGKSLIQGAMEALEYAKGQTKGHKAHKVSVPAQVDVAEIRKNYI